MGEEPASKRKKAKHDLGGEESTNDPERYLLDAGKAEKIDLPFQNVQQKMLADCFIYGSTACSKDLVLSELLNLTNQLRKLHTDLIAFIWKIKKRNNPPGEAVTTLNDLRDNVRSLWDFFLAFKTNDQIDVKKVHTLREVIQQGDVPIPSFFEVSVLKYKSPVHY